VALPLIARSLTRAGVAVDVATTDDDGPGKRLNVPSGVRVENEGWGVFHFPKQSEFYKVSLPLRRWLNERVKDYDVVHVHALFSFTSTCAARCARRQGVPYVLRPLGVLNRWGMENRRPLLKSLSFRWVERPILRHAAAMHYTSEAEQREAEAAGATAPAAVIPLGIEVADFAVLPPPDAFLKVYPQAAGRPLILFLSRLDEKKGLDLLLPAFAAVKRTHPRAVLVLAGTGHAAYLEHLRREAKRLTIADDVLWPGFLDGADKLAAFAAATVYVLPSYSENFGLALVEALAAGLPCVTTTGVAVSDEIRAHDAGRVTAPDATELAQALDELLKDEVLRGRLGASARRLAGERFSSGAMGASLLSMYQRILAGEH
jgi:glycosyltransferase involved in cell wall biosynthesis